MERTEAPFWGDGADGWFSSRLDQIRAVLERIHLGEFFSKEGRILQRTELTPDQIKLLKQLDIPSPAKIQRLEIRS